VSQNKIVKIIKQANGKNTKISKESLEEMTIFAYHIPKNIWKMKNKEVKRELLVK
jgi:hypothetical protein